MVEVQHFFDSDTFTLTYVVYDPNSRDAVIIDPVWDYDPAASQLTSKSIEILRNFIDTKNLNPIVVLETHAHADHVSSAHQLKSIWPALKVGIGANIQKVQQVFKTIYGFGDEVKTDGSQFDMLLQHQQSYQFGSIKVEVRFTPGHTPACCSYVIDKNVFVGDLMFMPDSGTGRCDFPLGSATDLYTSVTEQIYTLPDNYLVHTGHDYQPGGRELRFRCTVKEQKETNTQLKEHTTQSDYVAFRTTRDKTLKAPRLLLPSVQININGARLREPQASGRHYLKIPISIAH